MQHQMFPTTLCLSWILQVDVTDGDFLHGATIGPQSGSTMLDPHLI